MNRADPRPAAIARWTLAMSICASSLSFIDGSILNVALPAIRETTGADAAEVQWVLNAFTLPLAALILLGGALGDHYGRRRWLVIGVALFAAASALCALSGTLPALIVGRALQGIGAAFLLPNSLALLNGAFTGEARGQAVGTWAAAGAISAAVAPLMGGWLVDNAGWPSIFWINLPLCLAAIAIALAKVEESADPGKARLDGVGAALATLGFGAATYGLTLWSEQFQLTPTSTAATLAGLFLIAIFLAVEHRKKEKAMVPLGLFANRCFASLNLMTFLLYGAFGGSLLLIPFVLIETGGYTPVEAGLSLLPLSILLGIFSPLMGRLATRIGPRLPLTIGPIVVGAGLLLATRIQHDQSYWSHVFPAAATLALGMTLAVAPLTSTILGSVDAKHTGMVSGLNSALSRLGGLIAVALMGAVLGAHGEALLAAFGQAMLFTASAAALGGVAAWFGLAGTKGSKT